MTDQIARTILEQLGGRRFVVMTGARNLMAIAAGLQLDFRGCRYANRLRVILDADDTYIVRFYKTKGIDIKQVKVFERIFCDGLRELFERETGLATAL